MEPFTYNRNNAVAYAYAWALKRNPRFYDFSSVGGDCTNFVSQCLYAGSGRMNFTKTTGWYYISATNRAPAWTSVQYLYQFLINNKGTGPYASIISQEEAMPGDILQLSFDGYRFSHSSLILTPSPNITVAQHSENYINRPLATQEFKKMRILHILGVR